MFTLSFVRKFVSVPVYAAVLSTILVACGTVTVKEERRTKGQQSINSDAAEQPKRDSDVAPVSRGLSLTLPTEMPRAVDTVSITLISDVKVEPMPLPAEILPAGDIRPPCMLRPGRFVVGDSGHLGAPCGLIGQDQPWYSGLKEKHPLAAAGIGKLATGEKFHGKKADKHVKNHSPKARLGKNDLVQPVAFIPLHWMDKNRPAGCGFGAENIGADNPFASLKDKNDPLAAFVDSDVGTNISLSSLNYYFGADQKEFAVEALEPGTYVVVIELIDSITGKVIESGETTVVVEAGKVAAANVKLAAVEATTGGVVITVERAPVAASAQTKK